MVKHNNVIPNQHFHKKWARRVRTWLNQPIQKKLRREQRKIKAAKIAPRPAGGSLRPLVHCPTQRYNSKVKLGRGFSLAELKEAGINRSFAQTIGISVDHRRINKSEDSLLLNVERLKEYKSKLIVFPRRLKKVKNGDSSKSDLAEAQQLVGTVLPPPKKADAVTYAKITDEMKEAKGYASLRLARSDSRLVGIRLKKSKEEKVEPKE
eukprot:gene4628-6507_t